MKRSAWASPAHPVVRRELLLWRKATRQLWISFLFFPLCCSSSFVLTSRDPASDFRPALTFGLWGWGGFLSMWLGVLVTSRAMTLIAHERETRNWELLRLTAFDMREIMAAKVAAVVYWLRWPIALVLVLRLLGVAAGLADVGSSIGAPGLIAGMLFLIIFCSELIISVLYNCAVGLLASAFSRTIAAANAVVYPLHFGLLLFIFAPVLRSPVPRLFEHYVWSNYLELITTGIYLYLVLILTQVVTAAIMFFIAYVQARRFVDVTQ